MRIAILQSASGNTIEAWPDEVLVHGKNGVLILVDKETQKEISRLNMTFDDAAHELNMAKRFRTR